MRDSYFRHTGSSSLLGVSIVVVSYYHDVYVLVLAYVLRITHYLYVRDEHHETEIWVDDE